MPQVPVPVISVVLSLTTALIYKREHIVTVSRNRDLCLRRLTTTVSKNTWGQRSMLQAFKGVENCDHYFLVNPLSQSPFPVPFTL